MTTLAAVRTPRPPAVAVAAAVATVLHGIVTCYGAYYFTFVFEDPTPSAWSYVFVAAFWTLTLTGAACAVGLVRGSRTGRRGLAAYCTLGLLWTAAKLVFWHETEALLFGAVSVLVLLAATSRAARAWTQG